MDQFRIVGGHRLKGTVEAGGSKNAALPIVISSLLTDEACRYRRVPVLQDLHSTVKILSHLGVKTDWDQKKGELVVLSGLATGQDAPYDLVRKMRASILVLGPLVSRYGQAKVSLPGGCAIGARPIQLHLQGLEKLGVEIVLEGGYVHARSKRLRGDRVTFDFPSVGATENLMMAATLASGETVLENCAREPEIVDLATALRAMGAKIEGDGTEVIHIQGRDHLGGAEHVIMGDRIEAGTYLAAGFITGGEVRVEGVSAVWLESVLKKFEDAGAKILRGTDYIELQAPASGRPKGVDISTQPFPGFPTDMQAQFMAVMVVADGASMITETIFENRFMHVPELTRLGADLTIRGNTVMVRGVKGLRGAPLMATDLRASASLVLAGLAAAGETVISRIYHLDRGYERMEEKLRALGAEVERI